MPRVPKERPTLQEALDNIEAYAEELARLSGHYNPVRELLQEQMNSLREIADQFSANMIRASEAFDLMFEGETEE